LYFFLDKRKILDEHRIDAMPAFAAPSARGIESRLVRVIEKANTESSEKDVSRIQCVRFSAPCGSRE
jgi:hypothetical protein